jgi:hypothetical protein
MMLTPGLLNFDALGLGGGLWSLKVGLGILMCLDSAWIQKDDRER